MNKLYEIKIIYMIIIGMLFFFSCKEEVKQSNYNSSQKSNQVKIDSKNFKEIENCNCYVVKFSKILIDLNGKKIIIPIYKGEFDEVDIKVLDKFKSDKNNSILGNLWFPVQKGKLKNTIIECIDFYSNSLLKNIDIAKPSAIGVEGKGLIIWYDFIFEGIESSIMIGTQAKQDCKICDFKKIYDIEVNEEYKGFMLEINIGSKSPFWK